jgi:hypothetical protein
MPRNMPSGYGVLGALKMQSANASRSRFLAWSAPRLSARTTQKKRWVLFEKVQAETKREPCNSVLRHDRVVRREPVQALGFVSANAERNLLVERGNPFRLHSLHRTTL